MTKNSHEINIKIEVVTINRLRVLKLPDILD